MINSGTVSSLRISGLISLAMLAGVVMTKPAHAQTPKVAPGSGQAQPIDPTNPNVVSPSVQADGLLSLQGGQRLMTEANQAVSAQNYPLATKKLQDARQVFNQLSNFYQDLVSSFSGVDNRVADSQRKKALDAAQMRDQATYQLALVHRAQNQPELAFPLLVQVIRSQQPTRELGKKAYQQLLELGYVDVQYPRTAGESSKPSANR
jgi:cell division septum initiation protein DivIVA